MGGAPFSQVDFWFRAPPVWPGVCAVAVRDVIPELSLVHDAVYPLVPAFTEHLTLLESTLVFVTHAEVRRPRSLRLCVLWKKLCGKVCWNGGRNS